jgi:uncharacterized membrane protein YwaF
MGLFLFTHNLIIKKILISIIILDKKNSLSGLADR